MAAQPVAFVLSFFQQGGGLRLGMLSGPAEQLVGVVTGGGQHLLCLGLRRGEEPAGVAGGGDCLLADAFGVLLGLAADGRSRVLGLVKDAHQPVAEQGDRVARGCLWRPHCG